jgi:hypothetical protein
MRMKQPTMSGVARGARVSGNSRGRSIFLNDPLWRPGLTAGQVPVLMLRSKEQDIMQEILVRNYQPAKGTIVRCARIPECARIRMINNPANLRPVSFFLKVRGAMTTPVVQDIDPEWEAQPCAGISHQEHEGGYTLRHSAAQNSCSDIKRSGDLSCAEE